MSWHIPPKDDAWRQVHLAYLAGIGKRLWLRCNACGHEQHAAPEAFAHAHALPASTPLLVIARRLVCSRCGARKGHAWPEPYAIARRLPEQ